MIKVAGVGTYVSATDDITRNDTWNWNGTVIDNNPATNITLSGGTHTVRCDAVGDSLYASITDNIHIGLSSNNYATPLGYNGAEFLGASGAPLTLDMIRVIWTQPIAYLITDAIAFNITGLSANAAARYIVGLYRINGRNPAPELLWTSAEQDGSTATGTSGNKVITFGENFRFNVTDIVGVAFHSNDSTITAGGTTTFAPVRGFGVIQAYGGGEALVQIDFTQTYVTTLPATLTISAGSSGGYYIAPTGLLRKA